MRILSKYLKDAHCGSERDLTESINRCFPTLLRGTYRCSKCTTLEEMCDCEEILSSSGLYIGVWDDEEGDYGYNYWNRGLVLTPWLGMMY